MFDLVQERDSRGTLSRTMVYLINQGESDPNNPENLTEKGKNQIFELARSRLVVGIHKLYTSPAKECSSTTEILGKEFDVRIERKDCLREISVGKKNPILAEFCEELTQMFDDTSFAHKKGESLLEGHKRIGECITGIAKRNSGEIIAVVAHPVICMLFDILVCGGDIMKETLMSFSYASCASYEYSKEGWTLVMPFENSFLSEPSCISDVLTID